MIVKEAIYHLPKSNFAYAYDKTTLHLRIRTKKNDIEEVWLKIGDPYEWESGGLDGGNLNGSDAKGWSGSVEISMQKELSTDYFDYWFCEYKPLKKRSRYAFILKNSTEKILFGEKRIEELTGNESDEEKLSNISNFFSFPYLNAKDVLDVPEWAKNTIWYQIFPERFCNGKESISPKNVKEWGENPTHDNFMGGDLYGIYEKLDYLEELGITGIYLCPIFMGNTNHKYDTIDYYKIDPHFGDEVIFKKLVEKAHQKGIKIMLDAVFNHVGDEFTLWKDVVKNGSASKYADWFVINKFPLFDLDGSKNYETFANVKEMPKLNLENKDCRKYILDVATYWIKEFDIDGWRLDVCNEIDHKFWREFREEVKSIKQEFYILGEIWHDSLPWLMGDQFDAVMNYPISDAIINFLTSKKLDAKRFEAEINKAIVAYPKNITEVNFNLLDSHDTARVLTVLKDDKRKLKLALLLLFFQSGSPCIYYGTEIGMNGDKYSGCEENRKCMIWDDANQDKELFNFLKILIKIRKDYKEFQDVFIEWKLDEDKNILVMKKETVFLIINLDEILNKTLKVNTYTSNDRIQNLINGIVYSTEEISLEAQEFLLLKNINL
ncbi:MAG: glycoside hydrolase family 13 protein [Cetobacterium sp.]|uniref:glycoside hydrolase family 13 protein n=1 Tax=Cetobacterium sp. TaxID=2071632 RepID=UPI003F2D33CF